MTNDECSVRLSVVIPAHNEEGMIERCLRSVLADPISNSIEVFVVCNGCTDRTAEIARSVAPQIRVLESATASKHGALNLGDREARGAHRAYLDADTTLSDGALSAIVELLDRPGVHAASPKVRFETSQCSWSARQFHRIWAESPYFVSDRLGAGFYALSSSGRARFDEFPPVVGDDFFVASIIDSSARATAFDETFTPLLPRTLRSMMNVHVRHYGAHAELTEWYSKQGFGAELAPPPNDLLWLLPLVKDTHNWAGLPMYAVVKILAKVLGKRKANRAQMSVWNRDEVSRVAQSS